jgi:pyruvate,orthophosphate dikinase
MNDIYVIAAGRPLAPGGAEEVGNKAWNLMQMADAGLAVPPAFVLPTALCPRMQDGAAPNIDQLIERGIGEIEALTGRGFGSARRPLLLSVRSGAAASMPGMMETVLNIGLNDETAAAMLRATGNPRLVWDSYRRLVESYGEIVGGVPAASFRQAGEEAALRAGVAGVSDLDFGQSRGLLRRLTGLYRDVVGRPFPQDVRVQLSEAIRAVFRSWNADKAVAFRRLNKLDGLTGTAVTVQSMVFGNMSSFSGSGVAFTRDPSSGANGLYLDFVFNAQGEDIVAGRHHLADAGRLGRLLPSVRAELDVVRGLLERRFGDAQDFEFTVEDGKLWLLQTRNAKRTPLAALRIAVDLVKEGIVAPAVALARVGDLDPAALMQRSLRNADALRLLGHATVASLGIAAGRVAFDPVGAAALAADGSPVILVRDEATTADIDGMAVAQGILTAVGGRTSHAAVVARQLGSVCLVGCAALRFDTQGGSARIGEHAIQAGDWLSLDGSDGAIYAGRAQYSEEPPQDLLAEVAGWRREAAALPMKLLA